MTRTATLAGLAVLVAFALTGAAGAAPAYACRHDPSDCPTSTVEHHNTLTVSTPRGTITSDPAGISCPSDCAQGFEYDDFCTNLPGRDECDLGTPVDVERSPPRAEARATGRTGPAATQRAAPPAGSRWRETTACRSRGPTT